MFTEYEVLFEPLNEKLKGYYNYSVGQIKDNRKMGFILGYGEILKTPLVISQPDPLIEKEDQDDEEPLLYHIKIHLAHTGSYYVSDSDVKKTIDENRKNDTNIAFIGIKINRTTLLNERLENAEKEAIANKIVAMLIEGRDKALKMPVEKRSNTNIPCFDINFPAVLPGHEEITGEIIEDNLDKITTLFGIKDKISSILEIDNQSLRPLLQAYPDLHDTEELEQGRVSIIEKANQSDDRVNIKFKSLEEFTEDSNLFIGKSCLMTKGIKKLVNSYIFDRLSWRGQSRCTSTTPSGASCTPEGTTASLIIRKYTLKHRLIHNCTDHGEVLMIVKDTYGRVFGGYFSQNLTLRDDFFGTGESFLFKLKEKVKTFFYEGRRDYYL